MKKVILSSVLTLATMFVSSCSKDSKDPVNTAPTASIVTISNHVANKNIAIAWSKAIDKEGDKVVYDVYANEKVIAKDQTTLNFAYDFSKQTATYPITFKVVAKDDEGATAASKEVLVKDPIIGKWQFVKFSDQPTTECDKKSTLSFFEDKKYSLRVFGLKIDGSNCIAKESFDAVWKSEKGVYFTKETADSKDYNKIDFIFSNNNNELSFGNRYFKRVE